MHSTLWAREQNAWGAEGLSLGDRCEMTSTKESLRTFKGNSETMASQVAQCLLHAREESQQLVRLAADTGLEGWQWEESLEVQGSLTSLGQPVLSPTQQQVGSNGGCGGWGNCCVSGVSELRAFLNQHRSYSSCEWCCYVTGKKS